MFRAGLKPRPIAAAALVVALLVAPSTRWVVMEQLRLQLGRSQNMQGLLLDLGVPELPDGSAPQRDPSRNDAVRRAAERLPDDPGAQIVLASMDPGTAPGAGTTAAARLREAASRAPDKAALWAAVLRVDAMTGVQIGRTDEQEYTSARRGETPPSSSASPTQPERLRAFVAAAEAGERADPGNGFFPLMRAAGLFALNEDDAALAAIGKAARAAEWEDYADAETEARLRLDRQSRGRQGAIAEILAMAATVFPHYALLRSVSGLAVYKALQAEQAGRQKEGLAIRSDLLKCADGMRAHARTSLAARVASSMAQAATQWPGGMASRAEAQEAGADERSAAYVEYVAAVGGKPAAQRAERQLAAAREARAIITDGGSRSPMSGSPARSLMARWAIGVALLSIALWCMVAAAAAWTLDRGKPATWRLCTWTLIALGVATWLVSVQGGNAMLFAACATVVDTMTGARTGAQPGGALALLRLLVPVAIVLVALLVVIAALVTRAAPSRSFLRSVTQVASVAGLVVVAVFALSVVDTARHEDRLSAALAGVRQNECALMAKVVGRPWPPAVP